jgi:WD40 repeat protein
MAWPRHRAEASARPTRPRIYLGLGHTGAVTVAAWSPDGSSLATGAEDAMVILWRMAVRRPQATLGGLSHPVRAIAWSPDGRFVAGSDGSGRAVVWSASTGERTATLSADVGGVRSLEWAIGGRAVLTMDDQALTAWDARTGARICKVSIASQPDQIPVVAVSLSGDIAAIKDPDSAGSIGLWNLATGRRRAALSEDRGTVTALAWNPAGTLLAAACTAGVITIWDARGRRRVTLRGTTGIDAGRTLFWSPDGRRLASRNGGDAPAVTLWDPHARRPVAVAPGDVAFASTQEGGPSPWSPNGHALALVLGVGQRVAGLRDATTGRLRVTLRGHAAGIVALAWNPGCETLATTDGVTGILWDVPSGRRRASIGLPLSPRPWSPDGRALVSFGDAPNAVTIQNGRTGKACFVLGGHAMPVRTACLAWSPDGMRLAAGYGRWFGGPQRVTDANSAVVVWDARAGAPLPRAVHLRRLVSALAWEPDRPTLAIASGQYAVMASQGNPAYWDWANGSVALWQPAGGAAPVILHGAMACAAWSPRGDVLATAGPGGTVSLWDGNTGRCSRVLPANPRGVTAVTALAWGPGGHTLAVTAVRQFLGEQHGTGGTTLWDAAAPRTTVEGALYSRPWNSAGSTLATALAPGGAALWDAATGRRWRTLPPSVSADGKTAPLNSLAWSPLGSSIATGSDQSINVVVWGVELGRPRNVLAACSSGVTNLAWSPDGTNLAGGCADGTLYIWEPTRAVPRAVLRGHTAAVTNLAWRVDSPTLATGSQDGSLRLWDARAGKAIAALYLIDEGKMWVAATSEGYFQASPGAERYVQWRLGNRLYPVAKFRRRFERHDLVRKALAGQLGAAGGHRS